MGLERRGCVVRPWPLANWKREEPVGEAKPFNATAEHREPCDLRGSCTVLGAPGGEIPSGDSTIAVVGGRPRKSRLLALSASHGPLISTLPSCVNWRPLIFRSVMLSNRVRCRQYASIERSAVGLPGNRRS